MTGVYVLCAPDVVHAKQQLQLLCRLSVAVPQLRLSPDSTAHVHSRNQPTIAFPSQGQQPQGQTHNLPVVQTLGVPHSWRRMRA